MYMHGSATQVLYMQQRRQGSVTGTGNSRPAMLISLQISGIETHGYVQYRVYQDYCSGSTWAESRVHNGRMKVHLLHAGCFKPLLADKHI